MVTTEGDADFLQTVCQMLRDRIPETTAVVIVERQPHGHLARPAGETGDDNVAGVDFRNQEYGCRNDRLQKCGNPLARGPRVVAGSIELTKDLSRLHDTAPTRSWHQGVCSCIHIEANPQVALQRSMRVLVDDMLGNLELLGWAVLYYDLGRSGLNKAGSGLVQVRKHV